MVVAGGGLAASAWATGIVTGMADAGLDVRDADLFVGTSSGSRVALHLAGGVAHEDAWLRRLQPAPPSSERPSPVDWPALREGVARAKQAGGSLSEILQRIGSMAVAAAAGTAGASRRELIAAQLPVKTWPEKRLLIAAVNVETGERRAFDRDSGIDLADAVIATTASFGWPPTLFQGHHYIDGGFYSTNNADLAIGYDRVMILALKPPPGIPIPSLSLVTLDATVNTLQDSGALVEVIFADENTLAAFTAAGGVMSPAISAPAAMAGRVQGKSIVNERLSSFWQDER
ncbi:MAG: patatin-like phospholipase family protein [Acidobacteriaceae bacterium]